jgi:hypothetical protein
MKLVGHVHHTGSSEMFANCWTENLKQIYLFEDQDIDGRITLKRILKKQDSKVWTGFIWLRIGPTCGFL